MLRLNFRRGNSSFRFAHGAEWMIPDGGSIPESAALNQLFGRRVLVLIHGFNVTDALDAYARIGLHVCTWYDAIIGVTWPGSALAFGFWWAARRADQAGRMLAETLGTIRATIDIEAHSLGCRVALEAMRQGAACRSLILAAPAVDDEWIEKGERYGEGVSGVQRVLVAHSRADGVLRYAYKLAGLDTALGQNGPRMNGQVPRNVRSVDLTASVASHGDYKRDPEFYSAWRDLICGD